MVMHTLKGVNIIYGTMTGRPIDGQTVKEPTMQPNKQGRVLLGGFSSSHHQFSTLRKERPFLCLVFLHFARFPRITPPPPLSPLSQAHWCPPRVTQSTSQKGLCWAFHTELSPFFQNKKKQKGFQWPPHFQPFLFFIVLRLTCAS